MNGLFLENWTVTGNHRPHGHLIVSAEYDIIPEACPKCGVVGRLYKHGSKKVRYRDTPAFGRRLVLEADVLRFRCRDCEKTSMQPLPDIDTKRQMTRRCVEWIEREGIKRPYAQIAAEIEIDEKTVRNICNASFERELKGYRPTAPGVLGIDELTLGRRRRAIFIDGFAKKVIDLLPTMDRRAVDRWLYLLHGKECVQFVTMDMWDAYRRSVQAILPKAAVVVDKWHIQSKAGYALDRVRARVRRGSKSKRNPWENKRVLQTSRHRLTAKRQLSLDGLLKNNPLLSTAWHAKEAFYDIWEAPTRAKAERLYAAWKANLDSDIETEFGAVAKTVDAWHDEVFAYFEFAGIGLPLTNAMTETMNGIIKIANRAGRGYGFDAIRAKAILALGTMPMLECDVCGNEYPARMMPAAHTGGGDIVPCPFCK